MIPWHDARRVCVIMPTWIGDICMATSALHLIRERIGPNGHVVALVRSEFESLLHGLDSVNGFDSMPQKGLFGPWRNGRIIASHDPDTVLVLPGSFRSALTAKLSGARTRIGYAQDGRRMLLSHAINHPPRNPPMNQVARYCQLVDPDTTPPMPVLKVTAQDQQAAMPIQEKLGDSYALLVPGANRLDKRWPEDRFAAVAKALHESYGLTPVISASPSEREMSAHLAAKIGRHCIDLAAAQVSISALKSLVSRASCAITNDTGPRHMAITLGVPVISLFGPTDHRWTMVPGAMETRLVANPFLNEQQIADDHSEVCQITRIGVSDVLSAIHALGIK